MNRPHIALDLLHHHTQPCKLLCLVFFLSFLPKTLMTLHAPNFSVYVFPVWNLNDVLVALHTKSLRMDALCEIVSLDVQLTHLPIGSGNSKSLQSVTAQAGRVLNFWGALLGSSLGSGLHYPTSLHTRQQNSTGKNPPRKFQNRRCTPPVWP